MNRIIIVVGVVVVGSAVLLWGVTSMQGNRAPASPLSPSLDPPDDGEPGVSTSTAHGSETIDAPVTWTHIIEVAEGEAYQGPWRMNESDFRYVDAPTVAMDSDGGTAVAWVDQSRRDVVFQRFDPQGEPAFPEPVNVSETPGVFSWLPRMVLDCSDQETVYLLWQEIVFSGGSHGGEIFFARSEDGGGSFSSPVNLSNTPAGAGKGRLDPQSWHNGSLALAQGPDRALYAAWTEYEGALQVRRSQDQGHSWDQAVQVAGEDAPARGPALAVAPDGSIWLAWTVGEDREADIHVARSTDNGRTFSSAGVVEGSGHADAPALAVDPEGTLHLAYGEAPGGPGSEVGIRYLRLDPGSDRFEEPRALEAPESHAGPGGGFPALSLDGDGNPWILWDLFSDAQARPLGLALAGSEDGGQRVSLPTLVPGTADQELGFSGSLQGLFMDKLGINESGQIAIVHGTFNPGERSRIRLHLGEISSSAR